MSKSRKVVIAAAILAALGGSAAFGAEQAKTAVILVKGIDPDVSADTMKKTAEFLLDLKVPFAVGVRPVAYGAGKTRRLSDNSYLVKNVKALSGAGTFLLQRTLPQDEARLNEQIGELVRNDMLPLGFLDIPPLAESRNYDEVSAHFSTIVREVGAREAALGGRFQRVIYIADRFEKERAAPGESDEKVLMGVVIGTDFDRGEVRQFVQRLKKQGYIFLDLKGMSNYVRSDDLMIVSNTWYYAGMPLNAAAYGGKMKLDLVKFRLGDSFLIERTYNSRMECVSEKVFDERLNGTALIDLPLGAAAYLVRQSATKPGHFERFKKRASILIFGKLSAGGAEDVFRLTLIVLFMITAVLTGYIAIMFIRAVVSGKSYQEF